MDVSEKWGDSVDAAVELALEDLNATPDEVDVEVLEQPSKGFLGLGAKLAFVRVTRKKSGNKENKEKEESEFSVSLTPKKKGAKKSIFELGNDLDEDEAESASAPKEKSVEDVIPFDELQPKKRTPHHREAPSYREVSHSYPAPERKQKRRSEKKDEKRVEKRDYDKIIESVEPIIQPVDPAALTDLTDSAAFDFLKNLIKAMGIDVTVTGATDGKSLYFHIAGKDSGTAIGKRGATLDAIQYLTSLVANKGGDEYVRVVVDAENYRAKREVALEKFALRLSDRVARTGRSVRLEPMNPYERKVIHSTLQKDPRVTTRSEGEDPYRRVVIEPK
ncbi:MAG: RNA-binding cell elongation regulator Jag/EloR [Eubacterium sp.]|jgi:spoIIIJ-associated protein